MALESNCGSPSITIIPKVTMALESNSDSFQKTINHSHQEEAADIRERDVTNPNITSSTNNVIEGPWGFLRAH